MCLKHLIKGIATYLPGLGRFVCRSRGRADSARYCYSVWLRHLVMVHQGGLDACPKVVAELGPGDTIGSGLAAMLTGADMYYALDAARYAGRQDNINIFNELVTLFNERQPIPGRDEFPEITPQLKSCEFPHHILTDERLAQALAPSRVQAIRKVLELCSAQPDERVGVARSSRRLGRDNASERYHGQALLDRATHQENRNGAPTNSDNDNKSGVEIRYFAPWCGEDVLRPASVDMIFSQAVLEHVEDLVGTYRALAHWLRPGGFVSHQIDFSSHGLARQWNGHWAWSKLAFKLIRGKRPWLINRQPYSTHRRLLEENGFEIVRVVKSEDTSGITRSRLSAAFGNLSDDDMKTRTAYVLARKNA